MGSPRYVRTGDNVRLLLSGRTGTHSVLATVVVADSDRLDVVIGGGASTTIPASAVLNIEVQSQIDLYQFEPALLPIVVDDILHKLGLIVFRSTESSASLVSGDSQVQGRSLAQQFEGARTKVEESLDLVTLPAHSELLRGVIEILDEVLKVLRAESFSEAEELRLAYADMLKRLPKSGSNRATSGRLSRSVESLVGRIERAERVEWDEYLRRFEARPRIVTAGLATINVDATGEFLLPVRVTLDDSYMPAREVAVVLEQHRGLDVVGYPPVLDHLESGSTKTIDVRMADRRRQGARGEITIEGHLSYSGRNNESRRTARQKVRVRLRRPAPFEPIDNPFRDYASGIPIDNPGMFFGREVLVDEIFSHLSQARSGRCYALYGQKRTGKSSVLEQVRLKLERDGVLVASVSMGTVDRTAITAGFLSYVLDQYRVQVGEQLGPLVFANLLTRWPDAASVEKAPLRSFQNACTAARALLRAEGVDEPRFAIVVDEFTYLFEILRRSHVSPSEHNELRDFMRQWKGMLEAKLFSALVVGQDTMPHFLQEFPNEFSVMHTQRLDYLTPSETERLADEPIVSSDGGSRFAGYALSTIPEYTDGHPFFTQIVCDRIVTIANEDGRPEISESDVQAAIETLLNGPREIELHKFDCLLSADNTGTLLSDLASGEESESSSDVALRVLHRLAHIAGGQNSRVDVERLQLTDIELRAYRDLVVRQVLTESDGFTRIRMYLFSEYLRRMSS